MSGSFRASLEQAIGVLAAADPGDVDGADLKELVLGVDRLRRRVQAIEAGVLGRFEESGLWATDAAYGAANWLTSHTGTSPPDAGSRVRMGKVLRQLPEARTAFEAGEVSEVHVRLLARGLGPRTRGALADQEGFLVGKARQLGADEFATLMAVWLDHVDQDGREPPDESDTLHLSRTLGGRLKGTFDLGPELAGPVEAAINEKVQELFRRDERNSEIDPADGARYGSAAHRRARALVELIEQGAGAEANPARRRPLFTVTIDPLTFAGEDAGTDAMHMLESGQVVPRSLVDLWRCDCEAVRAILSAGGALLDLGRSQRDEQRRALVARDRGCAVPGCDRPASWCDAHHVRWWHADGGPTNVGNLVLLCRHHHRRIHAKRLEVTMDDGKPRFWRSDGVEISRASLRERRFQAAAAA